MTQRTGMVRSLPRGVFVAMCVALSLAAGALLTGCDEDNILGLPLLTSGVQQAIDERDAARTLEKMKAREAESEGVMKVEDDAVQLEGKWTWPSLTVDYTGGRLQNPRIYPIDRVGEGWTFTIVKKGEGYTTVSGGTVTLKGTNVTITEDSSDGDSITLTGEVEGDTIVGTVHQSIAAKTLSSGVAQGAGEYDGQWTAARVK